MKPAPDHRRVDEYFPQAGVFFVYNMNVAGRDDDFPASLPRLNDLLYRVLDTGLVISVIAGIKQMIIGIDWLDFQIIIKIDRAEQFLVIITQGEIKNLAVSASAADKQPVAVLGQELLRDTRLAVIIDGVRGGNDFV